MRLRTVEISVGIFMLVGILAMAFLAVQVSGLNLKDNRKETYKISGHFSNVSGLAVRAKVTVSGVVVGRVTAITLDPADTRAIVEMAIDKHVNYLTTDSIAAIQTAGILGEKYISITTGGETDTMHDGSQFEEGATQPALVLEDLIGKFLTSAAKK